MKYLDLATQDAGATPAIREAIDRVVASGNFILGEEGRKLEAEIAAFCGVAHGVGLNSGTDALQLSLLAHGVGSGDEVITTPFTFIATAEMIARVGAKPVFVDIDPATLNIDADQAEEVVSPKTRAIIPVHLYGLPAEMDAIVAFANQCNIAVIEDAAQAIGATYRGRMVGALGDICCFSFFPAKNLGGYGDGGMVVTNNRETAEWIRKARNHGSGAKYHHEFLGQSSRLDEIQAAIIRAKLAILPDINAGKQRIAAIYAERLRGIPGVLSVPSIPEGSTSVFQQFTIRVERRDALQQALRELGIPTAIHYPMPLHLQPAFRYIGYREGDFPIAERASREVLSLPCYHNMPMDDVERVITGITQFFS